VGVFAQIDGDKINVRAIISSVDGVRVVRGKGSGVRSQSARLGKKLAARILDNGGKDILKSLTT
ncbi:MAG: hydroxymethylbilane synthase, partial [Selenomonadaceae bacterium]|nr:hydroxymethylbilane synthase [Selenomonadaceae bacterium]